MGGKQSSVSGTEASLKVISVERPVVGAKAARRAAAHRAAIELAREGGYDAVSMDEVAARSGVSRATLYNYFASKDHLLFEAWQNLVAGQHPPRRRHSGRTVVERVRAIATEMIDETLTPDRAWQASAIAARRLGSDSMRMHPMWQRDALVDAIGDALDPKRREDVLIALGYALLGIGDLLANGGISADEAHDHMQAVVRACFPKS